MGRSAFPRDTFQDAEGNVLVGASVEIRRESDNGLATIYDAKSGGSTVAQPLTTDGNGQITAYVDGSVDGYRVQAVLGDFSDTRRHVAAGTLAEYDFPLTASQITFPSGTGGINETDVQAAIVAASAINEQRSGSAIYEGTDFTAGGTFTRAPANRRHDTLKVHDEVTPLTADATVDLNITDAGNATAERIVIVTKGDASAFSVTVTGFDLDGLGTWTLQNQWDSVICVLQTPDAGEPGVGPDGLKFERASRIRQNNIAGAAQWAAVAGGPNDYTLTLPTAPVSYAAGLQILFSPTSANTGAVTVNVNGLGVRSVVNNSTGLDLGAGTLLAGSVALIGYDGSAFRLLSNTGIEDPDVAIISTELEYTYVGLTVTAGSGTINDAVLSQRFTTAAGVATLTTQTVELIDQSDTSADVTFNCSFGTTEGGQHVVARVPTSATGEITIASADVGGEVDGEASITPPKGVLFGLERLPGATASYKTTLIPDLIRQLTRGAGSIQPKASESGARITTDGALTIPNNVPGVWFTVKLGGDHDITFNSLTLDVSGQSWGVGDVLLVEVLSATSIEISRKEVAEIVTEADFV